MSTFTYKQNEEKEVSPFQTKNNPVAENNKKDINRLRVQIKNKSKFKKSAAEVIRRRVMEKRKSEVHLTQVDYPKGVTTNLSTEYVETTGAWEVT